LPTLSPNSTSISAGSNPLPEARSLSRTQVQRNQRRSYPLPALSPDSTAISAGSHPFAYGSVVVLKFRGFPTVLSEMMLQTTTNFDAFSPHLVPWY